MMSPGTSSPDPSQHRMIDHRVVGSSNSSDELMEMDGISRLRGLYPFTDVMDLPKCWSPKDKANNISLSDQNMKVHYKGHGKGHKDAASVRASHPVPSSCQLYYFEIRIVSKGRDGYMGIGLASADVNMQRLPGWDKQSYGYHGDDGNSFCSSGTGLPYGPTFTTGDVIGCGFNLIEGTCFYTKNGLNLGRAFAELPKVPLYPTVGLQTPGEEVEANFGTEPFVYDIEDDMKALRARITTSIVEYPVRYTEWQNTMHQLVQSWLIHNGYCCTAQVFSTATRQPFNEDVTHIKQRLTIQKLVLNGRIKDAIAMTYKLYPDVLDDNPNLLFALKCREFIEKVKETDWTLTGMMTTNGTTNGTTQCSNVGTTINATITSPPVLTATSSSNGSSSSDCNGNGSNPVERTRDPGVPLDTDVDMVVVDRGGEEEEEEAEVIRLEDVLELGRRLHQLCQDHRRLYGPNEQNNLMLREASSLLAYPNPESSPVGWLMAPSERETVCQQLNNAIVIHDMGGNHHRPPLDTIIKHSKALIRKNSYCGGWLLDKL